MPLKPFNNSIHAKISLNSTIPCGKMAYSLEFTINSLTIWCKSLLSIDTTLTFRSITEEYICNIGICHIYSLFCTEFLLIR